jgi:NAD(P)-dependent dehydrogenase (short-subunit alcohol dehydrogenase family)
MKKTWFITGAAGGIGEGIAKAALGAGHNVVATDSDHAMLTAVYESYGDQALALRLDIRDADEAQAALDATLKRFERIDVLVNNAGFGQFGPFEEIEPEAIERQFAVNLFGTFNVTRTFLPVFRGQRSGHIINMSSNGGFKGVAGASMYSSSKFAIEGFSESLAQEVAGFGIKITIVEPGAFRTSFLDEHSLKLGTSSIEDYTEYWSRAKAVFEERNGKQAGDPAKLGAAIVAIVEVKDPPLRFVAGPDALKVVDDKLRFVAEETTRWRTLSASTNY